MSKGNNIKHEIKKQPPKSREEVRERPKLTAEHYAKSEVNDIISEFNLFPGWGNTQEERINDELSHIDVTARVLLSRVSTMTMQEAQNTITWAVQQISTLREIQRSGSKYSAALFNAASESVGQLISAVLKLAEKMEWSLKLDGSQFKGISEDELISPFIPWDDIEKHI